MLNNYANIIENKKLTITNYKLQANIEGVINYNWPLNLFKIA